MQESGESAALGAYQSQIETLKYTFTEAHGNADRVWQDKLRSERLASDLAYDPSQAHER